MSKIINVNSNLINIAKMGQTGLASPAEKTTPGQKFGEVLRNSIAEVNRLQVDADKAINALATGSTDNVAEVMTAVQKADLAFKTLLQIRNKLMDAYDEIKQMKV